MTPQPDPVVFLAVLTFWGVVVGAFVGACYLLSKWYWRRHPIAPGACWKCGELLEHHCSECGTDSCPECGPVWS